MDLKYLNKATILFIAGAAVLVCSSNTRAGSVIGSQTFSVDATKLLDTNSVTTATEFKFSGIETTDPSDGDFNTVGSGTLASSGPNILDLSPLTFLFGNASFGTFTATSLVYDIAGPNFRNFEFLGTFTGGTLFPGLGDAISARLDIGLTQVAGPGRPVSASFTLVTVVPEPSSVVAMGLGLFGPLGITLLRRKPLPA